MSLIIGIVVVAIVGVVIYGMTRCSQQTGQQTQTVQRQPAQPQQIVYTMANPDPRLTPLPPPPVVHRAPQQMAQGGPYQQIPYVLPGDPNHDGVGRDLMMAALEHGGEVSVDTNWRGHRFSVKGRRGQ